MIEFIIIAIWFIVVSFVSVLFITRGARSKHELSSAVRKMFEVYDRPYESGRWSHVDEYQEIEAKVRELVGSPPSKRVP